MFGTLPHARLIELEVALKSVGYPEHQVRVETRIADSGLTRLENLAGELVKSGAEVIVAVGTPATLAALKRTRTVPIVAVGVSDPVALGFARSLAKPSGNVTGLSLAGPELMAKGLDLLVQAVPGAQRVAILWNPSNPGAATAIGESHTAARLLGVRLFPAILERPETLAAVLQELRLISPQALLVVSDSHFMNELLQILRFAREARLPTMFQSGVWVERGGLMAYGPSVSEMQRRATAYVAKILRGAKPEDLPFEEPTRFELVVNLRTAKALGLTIPPSLLARADQVIE
jgi:putative ABC transport system substrate-binding protein